MVWACNEDAGYKITQEDIYIGTHWKETYRKTKDKMERSGDKGLGEKRPELEKCYKQESMERSRTLEADI